MSEEEHTVLMEPEPGEATPAEAALPDESPTAPEMPALPPKVYRGNGWDITALLATATGVLAILSCGTFGAMIYCLPLLPLILGIVAVVAARRAAEPRRSRVLGWIGLGSGALTTLILIALAVAWLVAMLLTFVLPLVLITFGAAGAGGGMPDWRNWGP